MWWSKVKNKDKGYRGKERNINMASGDCMKWRNLREEKYKHNGKALCKSREVRKVFQG